MEKKKNLLVLGSSSSMPRQWDGIHIHHTYPYMLGERYDKTHFVFNTSRRANTSTNILVKLNLHDMFTCVEPDLTVFHFGITDCAPRLFTQRESKILGLLPSKLSKTIINFFSKRRYFFTQHFPKVYVKLNVFEKNIEGIFAKAHSINTKGVVLGILLPPERILKKSHNYKLSVTSYNNVLRDKAEKYGFPFIDVNQYIDANTQVLDDGFHYTIEGNAILFELLQTEIDKILA